MIELNVQLFVDTGVCCRAESSPRCWTVTEDGCWGEVRNTKLSCVAVTLFRPLLRKRQGVVGGITSPLKCIKSSFHTYIFTVSLPSSLPPRQQQHLATSHRARTLTWIAPLSLSLSVSARTTTTTTSTTPPLPLREWFNPLSTVRDSQREHKGSAYTARPGGWEDIEELARCKHGIEERKKKRFF